MPSLKPVVWASVSGVLYEVHPDDVENVKSSVDDGARFRSYRGPISVIVSGRIDAIVEEAPEKLSKPSKDRNGRHI